MNTYNISGLMLQKIFATTAVFAMVFLPLAGVPFAGAHDDTEDGSITIYKTTNDVSGAGIAFDFTGDLEVFEVLGDNIDSETFVDLAAGEYIITELSKDGWEFDNVICNAIDYTSDNPLSINLGEGEDVVCTFSNKIIPVDLVDANIVAHKIVCTDESEIPNKSDWDGLASIDGNTAQDWVDSNDSCEFEQGWEFEWVLNSERLPDPGDSLVGPVGGDWTTFGPTDVNGKTSVSLSENDLAGETQIWLREVLKKDYLSFSHNDNPDNSNDVSAGFYCDADVLNYDNYEWIKGVSQDETYNCVAWNYIEPILGCTDPDADNYNPDATLGNEDAQNCEYTISIPVCDYGFGSESLISNGSFEEDIVTNGSLWERFGQGFTFLTGWLVEKVSDTTNTSLELHREWGGNEASDGLQYAELDGDQPVRIYQDVATEEGARYELRWAFAPRQGTSAIENELSIEVNGSEVATEGPSEGIGVLSQDDWTLGSYEFDASSNITEIAFKDLGFESVTGGDVGTFLDDTVLCKIADPEPENPWCSYEGIVIDYTADEDAKTNGGAPVNPDRRNIEAVETIAPYANFGGKEGNDWQVNPLDFFSLGIGGFVTYEFTGSVAFDQAGPDIAIYEITGGNSDQQTSEKVEVEVSENGFDWESLGTFVGDAEIDISPAGLNYVKFVRLTDMSQGVQGDNGDGYDLDGIVILNGSCGVDPEPEECVLTIVSDDTATVVEKGGAFAKLLSFIHPAWTAIIPGAQWIWGDDPVVDPSIYETQTFVNQFGWAGTVNSATLHVASDNDHSAVMNGEAPFVGGNSFATAVSYDVTGQIVQGNNDLEIAVTNTGVGNSTYRSNPAGLLYRLTIEGEVTGDESCQIPYVPEPETYPLEGYKWNDEDENGSWDEETENGIEDWGIIIRPMNVEPVDAVNVPALGDSVSSNLSLIDGNIYLVEVSGTYRFGQWGEYGIADAEWAFRNDEFKDNPLLPHGWTKGEYTYSGAPDAVGLDLQIDGQNIEWGSYNDEHLYKTMIEGDDSTLEFFIYDSYYGDNEGGLTVEIYDVTDDVVYTDVDGLYSVELPEGEYQIVEIMKEGWEQTYPVNPSYYHVSLPKDLNGVYNFGNKGPEVESSEMIEMCKYDENENIVAEWGMTLTNGEITYNLETGSNGCVSQEVDPDNGPWDVTEETRINWTFVEVHAENGTVEGDNFDSCQFFGPTGEDSAYATSDDLTYDVIISEYRCSFMNDEGEGDENGGGGGSSQPLCKIFDIDEDILSWETRKGYDLEIILNGEDSPVLFSTTDNDEVDEGKFELLEPAVAGDEFELTVFRGSKKDTCTIELGSEGEVLGEAIEFESEGEVLGEAIEIIPTGAPDTGAGGAAGSTLPVLPTLMIAIAAIVGVRKVKNA